MNSNQANSIALMIAVASFIGCILVSIALVAGRKKMAQSPRSHSITNSDGSVDSMVPIPNNDDLTDERINEYMAEAKRKRLAEEAAIGKWVGHVELLNDGTNIVLMFWPNVGVGPRLLIPNKPGNWSIDYHDKYAVKVHAPTGQEAKLVRGNIIIHENEGWSVRPNAREGEMAIEDCVTMQARISDPVILQVDKRMEVMWK